MGVTIKFNLRKNLAENINWMSLAYTVIAGFWNRK
jgi:hypothetical protein